MLELFLILSEAIRNIPLILEKLRSVLTPIEGLTQEELRYYSGKKEPLCRVLMRLEKVTECDLVHSYPRKMISLRAVT